MSTMSMGEIWSRTGAALASFMFAWAVIKQFFPYQLQGHFEKYVQKLIGLFYPYIQITFHEQTGEYLKKSEAYTAIQNYLMTNSTAVAKRLKADVVKNSKNLVLSMDDYEEVTDEFEGVKVWWQSNKKTTENKSISFYPVADDRRFYKLTFHRRDRKLITDFYLDHVLTEGKLISVKNRQRKLHSNVPSQNWYGWKSNKWSHVPFEHPATFDTLAMTKKKKEEIKKDLIKFSKGKDYYKKVGKPWKRGYLLYGPPGTGKSTMIAAIANFMDYDVYDLELTAVKDNTELRRLLIDTSSKSIIVIEDIDCSLDLTGQRKKKEEKKEEEDGKDPIKKELEKEEKKNQDSKVTLSGLLNFIDGLWSACGSERIIVFTTNFIDKLDPALIRRGRMDKHIEMSYCCFEAFEFLAKNYLEIESHELFPQIKTLLEETDITPADVAENLMPKSEDDDPEACLKELIEAMKTAKKEAIKKAEDEKKAAEEEERKKAKEEDEEKKKKKKETEEKKTEAKENGDIGIENGKKD